MKLYHTQGVWPFKISTLHFTRLPYYTNLHGNLSRSSNERWRWGRRVGGTRDWRRVLRTLIGVRMVQCEFVQIHTLGKLKSHFSPSHSFICCNLMRITHPLVPLQFHALKTILGFFILHISSSFLNQLWHSLPSGWCHLLSLQSLFLPKLLSASIINPLHKLYMYNSFNLSCGNRVLHEQNDVFPRVCKWKVLWIMLCVVWAANIHHSHSSTVWTQTWSWGKALEVDTFKKKNLSNQYAINYTHLICQRNIVTSLILERERERAWKWWKGKRLISNLILPHRQFTGTIADINVMFLWQKKPQ